MMLKKHWLVYVITSLVLGSLIAGCGKQSVNIKEKELSINEIFPQSNQEKYWEPVLFETINSKLRKIDLQPLKSKNIVEDDLEIRLWTGFGEDTSEGIKGLILKKTAEGKWTGVYLPNNVVGKMAIQNKEPKSGWNVVWGNLNNYKFLTILDITESKNNIYPDAPLIVVEIKDSEHYRNYMQIEDQNLEKYPELRTRESGKLTAVCRVLTKEFGVPLCSQS